MKEINHEKYIFSKKRLKRAEKYKLGHFPSNLCVLFVALKLTMYISWSWILVLSPVWVTLIIHLADLASLRAIINNFEENELIDK